MPREESDLLIEVLIPGASLLRFMMIGMRYTSSVVHSAAHPWTHAEGFIKLASVQDRVNHQR